MMRNTVLVAVTNVAKKPANVQKLLGATAAPVPLQITSESRTVVGYLKEPTIQIIENGVYNETPSSMELLKTPVEVAGNMVEDFSPVIGIIESNIYDSK